MLKKPIIVLAITLIFSTNIRAEEVIVLNKGDIAPFAGILMDNNKANDVRLKLTELDFQKSLNSSYEKSIKLYKDNEIYYVEKTNTLLSQNKDLINTMRASESLNKWENMAWFGLGIIVTIAGGLLVRQAAR
jgi:hypothetical protein